MGSFSRTIEIGTDGGVLLLFHPDDLGFARDWPVAWYVDPFIYPQESAAGRLVGWSTGGDGGFACRFTDGALTPEEAALAGRSWRFPYEVRHGRFLLDNSDVLPGQEQMEDASSREWIEVPNGAYVIDVTAVRKHLADKGEARSDPLPDYVVRVLPLDGPAPEAAEDLPNLDAYATDAVSAARPVRRAPAAQPESFTEVYPAFVSAQVKGPGLSFSSRGEGMGDPVFAKGPDGEIELHDGPPFLACGTVAPGAVGVLAKVYGSRWSPGEDKEFKLQGKHLVRITSVAGWFIDGRHEVPKRGLVQRVLGVSSEPPAGSLPGVRVEPLVVEETGGESEDAALRALLLASLQGGALQARFGESLADYWIRYLEWPRSPSAVGWAMEHLEMRGAERLELLALSRAERARALAQRGL